MWRVRNQAGQTAVEYLGMILIVAVVIAALLSSGIGTSIYAGIRSGICQILGDECASPRDSSEAGADSADEQFERRVDGVEAFAAGGAQYTDLLEQARAAHERGDLVEQERLLDLLEMYQRLSANDRGDLITDVAAGSDEAFEDLVDQVTIEDGSGNRRYFQIDPSPGDGVIVMDYYIPTDSSGGLLKGDGRGTVDPLLGDAGLDDSRMVIVIDRETGRGVIRQSETCSSVGGYCESPRPIEFGDVETKPQINPLPGPQGANEFDIQGGDGTLSLEYDALNSVTPVGISIDGTVELERGENGTYEVTRDDRDPYPQIVTGHYRPESGGIIDEKENEGVFPGAAPGPVRDVIDGVGQVDDVAEEVCDGLGPFGGVGCLVVG